MGKSKATSARTALTAGSNGNNGQKSGSSPEVPLVAKQAVPGLKEQKARKRLEAESRNAIAKARREKEKHLHELEMKIAALEGQQKELAAALEDPATYQPGGSATTINRNLSALTHDLARLTAEWENATALVAP